LAKKILLSVAGFDPTTGAGVGLDLRVFRGLGFQGMALLTSLTAQNTRGVSELFCLPPEFLWNQYRSLAVDVVISGIKVGMIGSKRNIEVVAEILASHPRIPKVLDPVFKSSSGSWLIEEEAFSEYSEKIKGKSTLLTPNLVEASLISGIEVITPEDMKKAAEIISEKTLAPCLIKGGHLGGNISDILFDGKSHHVFEKPRLDKKVHGTGCFLSSSLLSFLVKGSTLKQAVRQAIELTHQAMETSVRVGQGQRIIDFPVPSDQFSVISEE
jgi:hydroxymethylpyrimidine kinase/phosphomethylpyrimidine kinase